MPRQTCRPALSLLTCSSSWYRSARISPTVGAPKVMTGPASSAAVSWPSPTWVTRPPSVVAHVSEQRPYPPGATRRHRSSRPARAPAGRLPASGRFRPYRRPRPSYLCQRSYPQACPHGSAAELAPHHADHLADLLHPQQRAPARGRPPGSPRRRRPAAAAPRSRSGSPPPGSRRTTSRPSAGGDRRRDQHLDQRDGDRAEVEPADPAAQHGRARSAREAGTRARCRPSCPAAASESDEHRDEHAGTPRSGAPPPGG